jgi:hypothetical protein
VDDRDAPRAILLPAWSISDAVLRRRQMRSSSSL